MRKKLPMLGFAAGFVLEASVCAVCFAQNPGPFGCAEAMAILGASVLTGLVGALLGFALRGIFWVAPRLVRPWRQS